MIRFRCQKCGQKIRAPSQLAEKKSKCPKCKSVLIIPKAESPPTQESKPISATTAPSKKGPDYTPEALTNMSNAEIAKVLLHSEIPADSKKTPQKKRRSLLVPHYDEATLFVMSITFILLCAVSKTMRADLNKLIFSHFDFRIAILLLFFVAGIFLSIFHAFSTRWKSIAEKVAMLFFAVLVSAGTGIYAGIHMFKYTQGWLMIFPIWNVIYGSLLLIMLRSGIIGVECISDRNARRSQIILGLSAAIIILLCCQFFFKLHWVITYSICIAYTTSLDRGVQSVFGQR